MNKYELWTEQDGIECKSLVNDLMPEELETLESAQNIANEMNAVAVEKRDPDDRMFYFVKEILE